MYQMCANTQNHVRKNLVYFQDLSKLAACCILSQMGIQFLVEQRNPVCNIVPLMIPNLIESSLRGRYKISLSVLMYLTVCLHSHQQLAFSKLCLLVIIAKVSFQVSWHTSLAPAYEAIRHETSGKLYVVKNLMSSWPLDIRVSMV